MLDLPCVQMWLPTSAAPALPRSVSLALPVAQSDGANDDSRRIVTGSNFDTALPPSHEPDVCEPLPVTL